MPDEAVATPALPLPEIITRYLNGESLQTIAPDYRVSSRTLYRWMLNGLGDAGYQSLVTDTLINRIADADVDLELAPDMCQVTRASHRARYARMDFERRRPALYGPKQELQVDNKITVIVQRSGPALPSPPETQLDVVLKLSDQRGD